MEVEEDLRDLEGFVSGCRVCRAGEGLATVEGRRAGDVPSAEGESCC